jgi:biotin synthase
VDPDVVPINFLVPIDGTPLQDVSPIPPMECLKIIAIYRYLFPRQDIKIAGGREVHLRDLQSWIFYAGANSFLIGNYLTTCGRSPEADRQMVRDLGLELEGYDGPEQPASPAAHVEYLQPVI